VVVGFSALILCLLHTRTDAQEPKLQYKFKEGKGSDITIEITRAPDYVYAFQQRPPALEKALKKGAWVVLGVSVLSAADAPVASTACSAVKLLRDHKNDIKLGLRPFVDLCEFDTWAPEGNKATTTPVWILLIDGRVTGTMVGATPGGTEEARVQTAVKWIKQHLQHQEKGQEKREKEFDTEGEESGDSLRNHHSFKVL
jgi:hypothetical protein